MSSVIAPAPPHATGLRWLFLLAILAIEFAWMKINFGVPTLFTPRLFFGENTYNPELLFYYSRDMWKLGLWIIGACLVVLTPRGKALIHALHEQSRGHSWSGWLIGQILIFAALLAISEYLFQKPTHEERLTAHGFFAWATLLGGMLLLWLLALAPWRFWAGFIRRENLALTAGVLFGTCAWVLIGELVRQEAPLAQIALWNSLSTASLWISYTLLNLFYPELFFDPGNAILGTQDYAVKISYACSGIEGITLISLFTALYLWLFRKELRFPQSFWLFPIGVSTIWLANSIRIATLIMVGTSVSPDLASEGFHAQAGWIIFVLIALGILGLSYHLKFFSIAAYHDRQEDIIKPLESALLIPLMALMAATMLTSAFSPKDFDPLYPVKIVAATLALAYFFQTYTRIDWRWQWQAPVIGIVVFVIWMALEPDINEADPGLMQGYAELSGASATLWLIFRVLGSVIVVPVVEEMAFRGYLLRKLIAKNIESVPLGRFTWLSFGVSSLLFGLLHDRWLAGTLAGMAYALAVYRHGRLGDAVVAHMTTNGLIALAVLAQGRWGLWA